MPSSLKSKFPTAIFKPWAFAFERKANKNIVINDKEIKVELKDNAVKNKAMWGTTRALINNAVQGVSVGFEKEM